MVWLIGLNLEFYLLRNCQYLVLWKKGCSFFFFKKQTSHCYFTAPYLLYKSLRKSFGPLPHEHSMEQATPTLNTNSLPHCLLCSSISGLSMPAGSLSSMFPVTKLAHKTCPLGSNPFSAPSAASTVCGVKRKNMLCVMLGPST